MAGGHDHEVRYPAATYGRDVAREDRPRPGAQAGVLLEFVVAWSIRSTGSCRRDRGRVAPIRERARQHLRFGERRAAVPAGRVPQVPVAGEGCREQPRRVGVVDPDAVEREGRRVRVRRCLVRGVGPGPPRRRRARPRRAPRRWSEALVGVASVPVTSLDLLRREWAVGWRGGRRRRRGGSVWRAALHRRLSGGRGSGARPWPRRAARGPPQVPCGESRPAGAACAASFRHHPPRGREAGAIPAQSRYGDRRSATAEVRSPAPRQSRTNPREKGAGRHDPTGRSSPASSSAGDCASPATRSIRSAPRARGPVIPAHARRRLAGFVLLPVLVAAILAARGAVATPAPTPPGPSPTAVMAPPATGRASTPSPVSSSSPSAPAATYPLTLTDDEGTAVTIPATPTTIVSLTPATTEILFAVGAGPRVRGVTDADDYPPAASRSPRSSSSASVYIEKIVGLGADLVGAAVGFDGVAFPSSSSSATDWATLASLLISFGGTLTSPQERGRSSSRIRFESGWQSYARANPFWGQARLQLIALRGGGYVGLSTTF